MDMIFSYRKIKIFIPSYSFFIPYAPFFAVEFDFFNPRKNDIVIDAAANLGNFTIITHLCP